MSGPVKKRRQLTELRGLGKEVWGGIDAQAYVDEIRDEWDGGEGRMTAWEDITIVDLDLKRSERIETDKDMFRVYFKLSAEAPPVWEALFEKERRYQNHTLFRTAKTSGEHIILECPLNEIDIHYDDLVKNAARTNEAYRKQMGIVPPMETEEEQAATDDRGLLEAARRQLFGGRG